MRSNTNELRKELAAVIKAAIPSGARLHHVNFPKPAVYPYAVYEVRDVSSLDGRTSSTLEIDCVDYSDDAKSVNNMADAVQDALDHEPVNTSKVFFHCYSARRYAVNEEDKMIKRIHLQMDLYHYTKED